MTQIVGFGKTWIETRLKQSEYRSELRQSAWLGRVDVRICYSPECLDWLLREAASFRQMHPPKGDWKTIDEMAQILGFGRTWVVTRLKRGRYQPEKRLHRRRGRWFDWCYSPECLAWLQSEADSFQRTYLPIDDFVPMSKAALELGHTREWIIGRIIDGSHRAKPQWRRTDDNQVLECISPWTLRRLLKDKIDYAPGGWYNIRQLSILTGWSKNCIRGRLDEAGVESMLCKAENGRTYLFYGPDALKVLGTAPKHYPPAGDNLTVRRMAQLLGRSEGWVRLRLKMYKFTETAQMMFDDCNRPRDHYTPMVYQTLKRRSEMEWSTETKQDSRKVG